jgi:hypothetical protein
MSPGPQAWNLSEPSRGVSQEDTYVLQSTPERLPQPTSKQGQSDGGPPLPEDDVDEYSDMLQVLHRSSFGGCLFESFLTPDFSS